MRLMKDGKTLGGASRYTTTDGRFIICRTECGCWKLIERGDVNRCLDGTKKFNTLKEAKTYLVENFGY